MSQKSSLVALAREQLELARHASSGRSAQTVFGGQEHVLHQTLIALAAGHGWASTTAPATRPCTSCGARSPARRRDGWEGSAGDLLTVPAAQHTLDALEDSAVLLTVGRRG